MIATKTVPLLQPTVPKVMEEFMHMLHKPLNVEHNGEMISVTPDYVIGYGNSILLRGSGVDKQGNAIRITLAELVNGPEPFVEVSQSLPGFIGYQ